MDKSKKSEQTTKDLIVEDFKKLAEDAEALWHATTDQAEEKVAMLNAQLQRRLTIARDRLADAELLLHTTFSEAREALEKTAVAAQDALEKTEKIRARVSETATSSALHARDVASKAVAKTRMVSAQALADVMKLLKKKDQDPPR